MEADEDGVARAGIFSAPFRPCVRDVHSGDSSFERKGPPARNFGIYDPLRRLAGSDRC